jgi:heat shock protein HtpX
VSSQPLLVYDRIDRNKRLTRGMLLAFAVAMLPSVTAASVFLVPFVAFFGSAIAYAVYGPALGARIQALEPGDMSSVSGVLDLPRPLLGIMAAILGLALAVALTALVVATAVLIARYGARVLLRLARARAVSREDEPELWRTVEALCIGAGLRVPKIHVIESQAANAFATGSTPEQASLVVTRGLLQLLDRRELEGVIAHELSHIGNHDIRLTTTLSAIVGTLSFPFRVSTLPIRAAFRVNGTIGAVALSIGCAVLVWCVLLTWEGLQALTDEKLAGNIPTFIQVWGIHALVAPLYAVAVAPIVALLIRQALSRQREFLADADAALLTRDPAGLAAALIKIGRFRGERLSVGEGSVHLYFVDPEGEDSLLHRLFPSHPPLEQRIQLLARMAQGIAREV